MNHQQYVFPVMEGKYPVWGIDSFPPQVDGCVTCVVCVCTCVCMSMYVTPLSAKYTKNFLRTNTHGRPTIERSTKCVLTFFSFSNPKGLTPSSSSLPPKSRHRSLRGDACPGLQTYYEISPEREKFRRGLRVQVSLSYNDIPLRRGNGVPYQSPCALCVMDEDNGRRVDLGTHLPPQPPIPGKGENSKKLQGFVVLR